MKNDDRPILSVEHLYKKYFIKKGLFTDRKNYIHAADDINLVMHKGSTLGLVGESGCGKSSLGKTILMLTPPSGGRVTFMDKVLFDVEAGTYTGGRELRELRKDIAMIFQDPYSSLNPKLTIGEAVREGVVYHDIVSLQDAEDYCKSILSSCGLPPAAYNQYPVEFSGGQRQRAVIARALALDPKLIVCDEPTAALDVSIQSQILNLMLDLKEQRDLTYLFISHNLGVTRHFCDEIAVMYLGKIVEKGPAEEVYSHSLHPYTKALIASLPVSEPGETKTHPELKDTIPSMLHVPGGCRFHTRCPYATEKCAQEEPEFREIEAGHMAACHLLK